MSCHIRLNFLIFVLKKLLPTQKSLKGGTVYLGVTLSVSCFVDGSIGLFVCIVILYKFGEQTTSTFIHRLKQNHSDLCITELCILELNTFCIKVFQMMPLVQNWICPRGDKFTFNYIEKT